ncbi:MAG: beta-ketoacyl-[acyl-carrier-protein] synthase family protein [Candidatus Eisenbacteria bacterium]|nr:beta-ketoacyl-[acyl-carrier-protein] synthase family protein [Candidatus Eisenbacteria bacterium]
MTGMGIVCALGANGRSVTEALREGRNGIAPVRGFDANALRSQHAGEVRGEIYGRSAGLRRTPDRGMLLACTATAEAMEIASPHITQADRAGVVLGTCSGGFLSASGYHRSLLQGRARRPSALLEVPHHTPVAHLARSYGLQGPAFAVSNACASGAVAIAIAADLVLSGRADLMIAGGYDALNQLNLAGFGSLRNTSPTNCIRPFDRSRDGLLLGEGAGIIILESEQNAESRGAPILGRVRGWGTTSDDYHFTAPDPSGTGAALAMSRALAMASVSPTEIDYVNAHGTGTVHNDRMEVQALLRVFGPRSRSLPMSSTKSMLGHTLGAAGAIEVVAALLALRSGFLPPTINFREPDPRCDIDCVPNTSRPATVQHFISNSFGFGGSNCSLLIQVVPP